MKKELLVKKLMDTTITFESVKKILISELDDRVVYIGALENLKLHDVSYYIGEKLNQIDDLSQSEFYENYSRIFDLFCESSYDIFEDRETIAENLTDENIARIKNDIDLKRVDFIMREFLDLTNNGQSVKLIL